MYNETMSTSAKAERLHIRATTSQKQRIEEAAEACNVSTSQFVLQQALNAAELILADQNRFLLPPDQYQAFIDRLDQPDRDLPNVRSLVAEKSPFYGS